MLQKFRLDLLPLSFIAFGFALILSISLPIASRAQSNQQVTATVGETTLTINGKTSPDTFVTVLKDSTPIGSSNADGSGNFSMTINFESGGIHQLNLFGTTPDNYVTDPLIASINVVGQQNTVYNAFLPPTIRLDSSRVGVGESVRVSGETIPNGTVVVTVDNNLVITTDAGSTGKWSAIIHSPSPGVHDLFAVAHDSFGQQSGSTRQLSFLVRDNVITPIPLLPIPPIGTPVISVPSAPIITSPQDKQYLNTRNVLVKGSARQGNLVEVWQDGHIVGSAYADADNSWQISVSLSKPHTILRARTCRSGVCSEFSSPINVYFSAGLTSKPLISMLDISSYSLSGVRGRQLILPLLIKGGIVPFRVSIDWGDRTAESEKYPVTGGYILKHTYTAAGNYNGIITVEDGNGLKDIHHFAVSISDQPLSSRIGIGIWALGIATIVLLTIKFVAPPLLSKFSYKK